MDSGDEHDFSSSLKFKKMYDDQLPKHDSTKNPEGTQKWLNACDDVVQSMTQAGGDKLVHLLCRGKRCLELVLQPRTALTMLHLGSKQTVN